MTWQRGRAEIERLLAAGELERVAPSPAGALQLGVFRNEGRRLPDFFADPVSHTAQSFTSGVRLHE